MPRVTLASATVLPLPDPDQPALVDALKALGAEVRVSAWDDEAIDWAWADVTVVRSTWNYVARREAFIAWAERIAKLTRLENPAAVLRHNTDKIYLAELETSGVPVVPTAWVERGASPAAALALAASRGFVDVVIKPRISAGSFATERFDLRDPALAAAFLGRHLAERAMMIQPYQRHVDDSGERSLVVIDGELMFAARKAPRFASGPLSVSGALPVADDERALARAVLARFEKLLYARVDMVRDESGAPRLMELELTEPYLMLDRSAAALARFAAAIVCAAR